MKANVDTVENMEDIEDRYEIHGFFDDGGYGDLYVGRDRVSGTKVAVKAQKPWRTGPLTFHRAEGEELAEEGVRMRALCGIESIPRIITTGTYKENRCLVMEFVEGRQLRSVVSAAHPVKDPGTVASIVGQLCEILWDVHSRQLVHCDLKPENVIVRPDGHLCLIDMGHAVRIGEPTTRELGTPGYAPPEQLSENSEGLTVRADIYALGCMLLEMTVLHLPYGAAERRARQGQPVLPAGQHEAVPPEFRDLTLRMVRLAAEERPADVREVFDGVRAYLPGQGARRPVKPLTPDPTEYYRTRPPRL
ncbi:serine/threonine protein kinase [Streptomyces nitrosporeus]|uniref:serine/threonine protein kinase n=1 Tax=Streptomyces nitrosporeus TaxID=28894 RepID=UPI0039A10A7D